MINIQEPTTVVLTGGTAGIGAVLRDRLLSLGHKVIVVARTATALRPADRLQAIDCDLSDPDAVRQVAATIAVAHPHVAIIINNAALQYDRPFTDHGFDPDRIEEEVAINLLAPALIVSGLLPVLQAHRRDSLIVNVNSGLAFYPKAHTALYCATKAGLHSLSQSLRYQLSGSSIRVAEVFLPLVDTQMTEGRGRGKIAPAEAADAILNGLAKKRTEIWVGKAKALPVLLRFAPSLARRALRGSLADATQPGT